MEMKKIISDIRKNRGLSQDEMAARLFVTRQAVSRWETGDTTPNIDTLKLIAQEFDVPAATLLGLPTDAKCQSCAMPLRSMEDFGTTADGSVHTDYCNHCMQHGEFTHERTLDEMIESNLRFLDEFNKENGLSFTPEQARTELKAHLSTLKRWKA